MNDIFEILNNCNWQMIIAMFLIGWYFTREIRQKLTALEKDVREEFIEHRKLTLEQSKRSDKLYEMFIELLKERK